MALHASVPPPPAVTHAAPWASGTILPGSELPRSTPPSAFSKKHSPLHRVGKLYVLNSNPTNIHTQEISTHSPREAVAVHPSAHGTLDPTKGPPGQPHPQSSTQGQVEEREGGRAALPGAPEKLQKVEGHQVRRA